MKIKSDFITNSSSSSFIVGFEKTPESVGEMMDLLFPPDDPREYFFSPFHEECWPKSMIAGTVFEDLGTPATWEEVVDEIEKNMWVDVDMSPYKLEEEAGYDWDAYRKEYDKQKAPMLEQGIKEFKEKIGEKLVIHIFEYCDNDGSYQTALEHGDLFRNLPHERISKH